MLPSQGSKENRASVSGPPSSRWALTSTDVASAALQMSDPGATTPAALQDHGPRRDHGAPSEPGEPQRRPARVRARRDALHGHRRRRGRGRSVPDGPEPPGAAREDHPHRPAPEWGGSVHGAGQQPVRRPAAVEAGDLGVRRPEPVALLVRPRQRRTSSSETSARTRGRRSTTARSTWGGGEASTSAGAAWRDGTCTGTVPSRPTTRRPSSSTHTLERTAGVRSPAATLAETRRCRACSAGTCTPTTAPARSGRTCSGSQTRPTTGRSPTSLFLRSPRSARTPAATCTSWGRAVGTTCSGFASRTRPGSSAFRSTTCPC